MAAAHQEVLHCWRGWGTEPRYFHGCPTTGGKCGQFSLPSRVYRRWTLQACPTEGHRGRGETPQVPGDVPYGDVSRGGLGNGSAKLTCCTMGLESWRALTGIISAGAVHTPYQKHHLLCQARAEGPPLPLPPA